MKKTYFLGLALGGALLLTGCGNGVDENKTPEQIKSETATMSVEDIQSMAAKYQKAIEEKSAEIAAETKKLSEIPLTEQMGDKAKDLRGEIEKQSASLKKLQDNLAAYLEALKQQK